MFKLDIQGLTRPNGGRASEIPRKGSPFLCETFFFLSSSSIPVGIRMDRPAGLSTTQVLKGSLLLESGKNEKEKQRKSFVTTSSGMN